MKMLMKLTCVMIGPGHDADMNTMIMIHGPWFDDLMTRLTTKLLDPYSFHMIWSDSLTHPYD